MRGYTLARAKESMGILREVGFTNQEISDLTKGAWSEPTVKLYSRGSEIKDSSLKQKALNLLIEFIDTGLSLSDIQYALSMSRDLDSKGLDIQGVSLFLEEAQEPESM